MIKIPLLALLALLPALSHGQILSRLSAQSNYPCETYEPNCDEMDDRGDNDDSDNAEDERPADPNGPDYPGSEDEI